MDLDYKKIKSRMFIAVCLDNYITFPYTIISIVPIVIARANTSGCSLYIWDNTLMEETLDVTSNSFKRKMKIRLGELFYKKHIW